MFSRIATFFYVLFAMAVLAAATGTPVTTTVTVTAVRWSWCSLYISPIYSYHP